MNIYGFYHPSSPDSVDLLGFLEDNLAGFSSCLCPSNNPRIIAAGLDSVDPSGRQILIYSTDLTFESETGEMIKSDNIFVIDPNRLYTYFAKEFDGGDYSNLLIALWQTQFHELRHFVQVVLWGQEYLNTLTLEDLQKIEQVNPDAAQLAHNHIKCYQDPATIVGEVDAVISAIITTMHFLHSFDDEGNFDFQKVVEALNLSRTGFLKNQQWLAPFAAVANATLQSPDP